VPSQSQAGVSQSKKTGEKAEKLKIETEEEIAA